MKPAKKASQQTYSEKLKDPRWQKKRLEILSRDEFMCRHCFDESKSLHVHHSYYTKGANPWDYPNESLVSLCEDCHARTEAGNEGIRIKTGDGSWKQNAALNFLKAVDSDFPFTGTSISVGVDQFNHFICDYGRAMKLSNQSERADKVKLIQSAKSALLDMIHHFTTSVNELENLCVNPPKERSE